MLPLPARRDLQSLLKQTYKIPLPDEETGRRGITIRPGQIRWEQEDYEQPDPPYDVLALSLDPAGVTEDNQPADKIVGQIPAPEGADADVVDLKGRKVYDELNVRVESIGNKVIGGESFSPSERANALGRAVHKYLLDDFEQRPLDAFDLDGNALPSAEHEKYGEELSPPVRSRPIFGRGPTNVTVKVDADAQTVDLAVRLHYVDSYLDYFYAPTSAVVDTEVESTY